MVLAEADIFFRFLERDFAAAGTGLLAAVTCGIIGSFLVVRRMSLMGDAISHAVLPGLIAAFVLTDSLAAMPIFIGAAAVGVLTTLLTETVHRVGKVESGASMGVVFTVLFAIGVIWLERIGGRQIHLDTDCVLHGNMQNVIWPTAPQTWQEFFTIDTLRNLPRQVQTLLIVLVVNTLFIIALFKELRITSFDPDLAASQGINPWLMHYLLMTVMAITTVASFEAVGSILVVAMLIVPGVVARLLTDRLGLLIALSAAVAAAASLAGYSAAAWLSLDATGSVGVTLGIVLGLAGLLSPKYGWISRGVRRLRMSVAIIREDMLAALYRVSEAGGAAVSPAIDGARDARPTALSPRELIEATGGGMGARLALLILRRRGHVDIDRDEGRIALTETGRQRASKVVRSHRLWETYLVKKLGLRPDHVHGAATRLEHITDESMRGSLAERIEHEQIDPHGRIIPDDEDET